MQTFNDKKTLITGAASGIGRQLTLRLAAAGAEVVALDINQPALDELADGIAAEGGKCTPIVCDLAQNSEIEQAAKQTVRILGGLDLLINNAGIGLHMPTHEMTHEQREQIMQVNLQSPFALFHHLIHHLMNNGPGHLVNISSVLGLVPHQRTAAYCASKYGLVGMTEAIRAEYARWGLSVTLVCPGFVDTPMLQNLPVSSAAGQKLRKPSPWLTTTPERIAVKVLKGIKKRKRLVLATPLAHFLYHSKRLFPGTYDFVQTFKTPKLRNLLPRKREKRQQNDNRSAKTA